MSCPIKKEELKIVNRVEIKKAIEKIKNDIQYKKYNNFPYYIAFKFNRIIEEYEENKVKSKCSSELEFYLKNEKIYSNVVKYILGSVYRFVTFNFYKIYKNMCIYEINLVELDVDNKDEIAEDVEIIRSNLLNEKYDAFPHYIICKLTRPWRDKEIENVECLCRNVINSYMRTYLLDEITSIKPAKQIGVHEDEFKYQIDLYKNF